MKLLNEEDNRRILVIDDNEAIHEDVKKALASVSESQQVVNELAAEIFDTESQASALQTNLELSFATQG